MNRKSKGFHISHVYFVRQYLSTEAKILDHVTLTLTFDLLFKNFNLGHNFWTVRARPFILHMYIHSGKTFPFDTKFLTLWPLTLTFALLLKNFNHCHNFLTVRARAFVFHMYIPLDKTFQLEPKIWTLWPLTLTFELLFKNFKLAIPFEL